MDGGQFLAWVPGSTVVVVAIVLMLAIFPRKKQSNRLAGRFGDISQPTLSCARSGYRSARLPFISIFNYRSVLLRDQTEAPRKKKNRRRVAPPPPNSYLQRMFIGEPICIPSLGLRSYPSLVYGCRSASADKDMLLVI